MYNTPRWQKALPAQWSRKKRISALAPNIMKLNIIGWLKGLFARPSMAVSSALMAPASAVAYSGPVTLSEVVRAKTDAAIENEEPAKSIERIAPVIEMPRPAKIERKKVAFRAPSITAHPSNDRKVLIDGTPWKMAHKVEPRDGLIAYRRPRHPNGTTRWIPPRLIALAAA